MRQLSQWAARCGRALRTVAVAVDPGEDAGWEPDEPSMPLAPPRDELTGIPTREDEDRLLDALDREIRHDLAHAGLRLDRARWLQRSLDTPVHRHAVQESRARIDALLDLYLLHAEIRAGRPDRLAGAPASGC